MTRWMYLASKKSVKAVMTPETPVRNGKPEKVIFRKINEGDMTILERKGEENVKGVSGHEKGGQGNKPAPVLMDSRLFELALSSSPSIGLSRGGGRRCGRSCSAHLGGYCMTCMTHAIMQVWQLETETLWLYSVNKTTSNPESSANASPGLSPRHAPRDTRASLTSRHEHLAVPRSARCDAFLEHVAIMRADSAVPAKASSLDPDHHGTHPEFKAFDGPPPLFGRTVRRVQTD